MERDPFTTAPGYGQAETRPELDRNAQEIARQQAEIDRERARLNQQISEVTSDRYALEGRVEREWHRLDPEAKRTLSEEHRVLGNQTRGLLERKEELREREARLDELTASTREASRAQERVRDREGWKGAGATLENRQAERAAHKEQIEELKRAGQERQSSLSNSGYLAERSREPFSRKTKTDREIEL